MSTCNRLHLQTLGSQPVIMPKNVPDHWIEVRHKVKVYGNLGKGVQKWNIVKS